MRSAGCVQIYFGVETGSQRLQRVIRKNLVLSRLPEIASEVTRAGIRGIYSFITGFPDETYDDVEETLRMIRWLADVPNTETQCHCLSLLPGTRLFETHGDSIVFDPKWTDAVLPVVGSEMRELIASHPRLFSAYFRLANTRVSIEALRRVPAMARAIGCLPQTLDVARGVLGDSQLCDTLSSWADVALEGQVEAESLLVHLMRRLVAMGAGARGAVDAFVALASVHLRGRGNGTETVAESGDLVIRNGLVAWRGNGRGIVVVFSDRNGRIGIIREEGNDQHKTVSSSISLA
jgi:hypothetical protein